MIGAIQLPLWSVPAAIIVLCFLPDLKHNLQNFRDWVVDHYYDLKERR